jgi:hypothetical protein
MVLGVAGWMSLLRLFGALGNVNLRFEDPVRESRSSATMSGADQALSPTSRFFGLSAMDFRA